jgi:hypothetical protein
MKHLHFTRCFIILFILFVSSITNAQNIGFSSSQFPPLSGDNLNGKRFHLPQDLPADKTLVLIAFEREQQVTLDSWSQGLDLLNSQIPWIEVPVISTAYILGSFIIDSGMRKGIPNPKVRDRVITLYTDREDFATSMGFEYDKHDAYVAVVDRSGKNLGIVKGAYSEEKAVKILRLLELQ